MYEYIIGGGGGGGGEGVATQKNLAQESEK